MAEGSLKTAKGRSSSDGPTFRLLLLGCWGLWFSLDENGEVSHEGRYGSERGEGGEEHRADHTRRQGELHDGMSFLILKDDASDVALSYQLVHLRYDCLPGDAELFNTGVLPRR